MGIFMHLLNGHLTSKLHVLNYYRRGSEFIHLPYCTEKRELFRESFLYEKVLKTNIYAVRFALITVFSFKK
jgi:hypothetical protein